MELLVLAVTLLVSVGVSLAAARTMLGAAFLLMARPGGTVEAASRRREMGRR